MNRATRKAKKVSSNVPETIDFSQGGFEYPQGPYPTAPPQYNAANVPQYQPMFQPMHVPDGIPDRNLEEAEKRAAKRAKSNLIRRNISPNPAAPQFQPQPFIPQQPPQQVPQHGGMYYGSPPAGDMSGFQIPGQLLQPAAASMAMQFGEALVGQGKQALDRELGRFFSVERLKYYFAVDTGYVTKKLAILTLPYTHRDWSLKYSSDEPVQPRLDVNAPDLYIPLMGYITFILMSGVAQGLQNRFTPEALGIEASSKLAWLTIEVLAVLLTIYAMSLPTTLRTLDIIAFCGYKYVGMIGILLASFLFSSAGYTAAWLFYSASCMFFLVRSLKVQVQPHGTHNDVGFKRTIYLLLFMAGLQPLLMWWLTRHLAIEMPVTEVPPVVVY